DKFGHFSHFLRPSGGFPPVVHPMAEKVEVRQVKPPEGIKRAANDKRQCGATDEAEPEGEQTQPSVVRAAQKLATIIWRLLFHSIDEATVTGWGHWGHSKIPRRFQFLGFNSLFCSLKSEVRELWRFLSRFISPTEQHISPPFEEGKYSHREQDEPIDRA